jgi:hypothetical protein
MENDVIVTTTPTIALSVGQGIAAEAVGHGVFAP